MGLILVVLLIKSTIIDISIFGIVYVGLVIDTCLVGLVHNVEYIQCYQFCIQKFC